MKRALAALCFLLMLALPCAVFAQSPTPAHCHLCTQCDQMHNFNAQPCCDQQPIPTTPPQSITLEAPALAAHLTLPIRASASSAAHLAHTAASIHPFPQRTTILRI